MPTYPHQLKLGKTYTPDAGVPERTASAVAALWALLEAPGLILAHRRHLLGIGIWKYTEAPGARPHPKYRLPFRTVGAMDVESKVPVQHEHVWTKEWLIDRLLPAHAAGWTQDELAGFMAQYGIACTVTRAEHLLLNACGKAAGWERYAQVGLQVWDAANERPHELPTAAKLSTEDDVRLIYSLPEHGAGVVSSVILEALTANEKPVTPLLRSFLIGAEGEDIDLVPKYDATGRPTPYIRLFDAELDEPTPVAVYINYNGNLDFHVRPDQVPDLMALDGVQPHKPRYVRLVLDRPERVDTALQLLTETLELIREA